MEKDWELLELLRHSRHDWLNQLQLIKGNLSLNRLDRVYEIIEDITAQSKHESNLTNLQIRELAGMLLTFNWGAHPYGLEIEVIGEPCDLSYCESELLYFCEKLFSMLDRSVNEIIDNHILLTFQLIEEGHFLTFEFTGTIDDINRFQEKVKEASSLHKSLAVVENYFSKEEFVLTMELTSTR